MYMSDSTEVRFLTIDQFKQELGITEASCLVNKKTGKLFLSASNGQTYKVQQDINPKEEMKVLIPEDGDMSEACLVNVSNQAEHKFTI